MHVVDFPFRLPNRALSLALSAQLGVGSTFTLGGLLESKLRSSELPVSSLLLSSPTKRKSNSQHTFNNNNDKMDREQKSSYQIKSQLTGKEA